ncbi:MAG TPA: (4Fe-4S)-binding protein [Sporichthyaceae bacterium]|nr:(4Fe-4S)-binding protein [Sporichthyaceae bacterium]
MFDVEKNPWVDPDAASIDEVKNAIRNCPSGALTMKQL